jgi:hypothetical protein
LQRIPEQIDDDTTHESGQPERITLILVNEVLGF